MLAFSNDYYGLIFRATQSVELFCAYSAPDRGDTRRTGTERPAYRGTEDAAQRISDLEREIKQREQSREYSSIKERLEAGRQSIAEREREAAKRKRHDRGISK